MTQTVSREQIKQRLDLNLPTTLVEALPEKYFNEGHLPGAINIPQDDIHELAPQLLPDKQAYIVVYCANTACGNSEVTSRILEQLGYKHVHEYVEGKQDWQDAGLDLEIDRELLAS